MADGKVDGGAFPMTGALGANLASRPLKTGATFTLVVAAPRVNKLAFDKADYAPGDACELSVTGKNLGKAPLEVTVEAEQDGVWMQVEKMSAEVADGQISATAHWKFPIPPGHREALAARAEARGGNLLAAAWAETEVKEGATHVALIEAERMEGQKVVVLIEQEFPDGSWRCVAQDEGQVIGGKAVVSWTPPQDARAAAAASAPKGNAVTARFEDGHQLGDVDTAWLKVDCQGLENETVQIVLEREVEGGWSEQGSAVSTVKVGQARTGILIR